MRRFQTETLRGYLDSHEIKIPNEVSDLLLELESLDKFYPQSERGQDNSSDGESEDSDDSDEDLYQNANRSTFDGQTTGEGMPGSMGGLHKFSVESLTLDQYRRQFGDIEGFGQYAEEKLRKQQEHQAMNNRAKNQLLEQFGVMDGSILARK